MPDELPEPDPAGKCLDCKVPLFFYAGDEKRQACFVCKRCGRFYRGAAEWKAHLK